MCRCLAITVGLLVLFGGSGWAIGPTWFLDRVPESTTSVPLKPVQLVDSWKGIYRMGSQSVTVYAVNSPWFAPPAAPAAVQGQVRLVKLAPWTYVVFLPESWAADKVTRWLERFLQGVREASALSQPGWPVAYPSLLAD